MTKEKGHKDKQCQQTTTQTTKDCPTLNPLNTGGEGGCSRIISSFFSIRINGNKRS